MGIEHFIIPFGRTHSCNDLGVGDVGTTVRLMGWFARVRNLGGLRFVDLRDRSGVVQLLVDPKNADLGEVSKGLNMEDVIACEGVVQERPQAMARDARQIPRRAVHGQGMEGDGVAWLDSPAQDLVIA